jgi:uncharacterized membrane protein
MARAVDLKEGAMSAAAISNFADWIASTQLSFLLASHLWIIPTLQSVHYMALAILFSSAALIDLRMLGAVARQQPLSRVARRFVPGIWIALVVMTITGLLLLIAEPARSLTTWEFQSKMAMLLLVIALTLAMQRFIAERAAVWDTAPALPSVARVAAVGSMVLWMLIIVAGRWIAYHA